MCIVVEEASYILIMMLLPQQEQEAAIAAQGRKRTEVWSWGITAWNAIACLLCPGCIYCMFGALLCNIFAYVDHRAGDYAGKQQKMLCSIGWSIGAFIASIVVMIVVIVVLFVVYDAGDWTSIPTIPGSDFTM